MQQIKIGSCISAGDAPGLIPKLAKLGFESIDVTFWKTTGNANVPEVFKKIKDAADEHGLEITCVSPFGNPMLPQGANDDSLASIERVIDSAHILGVDLVTGFTGRIVDRPVEESIPEFKRIWGELLKRAESKGLRIAFENCNMGGTWDRGGWNIAFNPRAWDMMFNELDSKNLGLQWEPCHQMVQLIDPIPQLRRWVDKIFHIHGKDATIAWDVIREYGVLGPKQWVWHRTPGFGDSNWADIITILRQNGYDGNIDIEGFHDPVYRGELEWSGQVTGLEYLKRCRGGDIVDMERV